MDNQERFPHFFIDRHVSTPAFFPAPCENRRITLNSATSTHGTKQPGIPENRLNAYAVEESGLPENVLRIERHSRAWNGVTVEDIHEYANGRVLHSLLYESETRLTVNLDEVGGQTEPRLKQNKSCGLDHKPNHMAIIPKGMHLWGYASDLRYCRYGILLFDLEALRERLGEEIDTRPFDTPRLRFTDARVLALVRMLIAIPHGDASSSLLGDSLTAAVFALLSAEQQITPRAGQLAPWQLRRVQEYMRAHLPRQMALGELAAMVGQSQWHFCRAFKASTGMSPYQWQLHERLNLVRAHLLHSDAKLETIAEATGFADAAHLSRAFKRHAGQSPSTWRGTRK
jgi:AraC family transcriptional regulator